LVTGIPAGSYTVSTSNKAYAVAAVALLRDEPRLLEDLPAMWRRISPKKHNQQMHVVAALWSAKLITR
jgi:hypothetical protein